MKRLFLIILFVQFVDSAWCQTFLNENFNTGMPNGFVVGNGGYPEVPENFTWNVVEQYVEPNPPFAIRRLNGTPFLMCNGQLGGAGSFMDDTLTTPAINTQGASVLILEFLEYYRDLWSSPDDSAFLSVFDGASWIGLDTITRADSGNWVVPKKVRLDISIYKNPNMKVRFRYKGTYGYFWAIDNLKIYVPQAKDVGVSSLFTPGSACGLSPSINFKVKVSNYGSTSQNGFTVSYKLNNSVPVTENYTGNLQAGATAFFTFTTPAALLPEGVFNVQFWTSLTGDGSLDNDTLDYTFTRYGQGFVNNPFTEFNGSNLSLAFPGWKEQSGHKPSGFTSNWQRSTAEQETFLGSTTAKVNLLTNVYREWIISPPFRPTDVSGLRFKAAVTDFGTSDLDFMGSDDSLKIMVSKDCGNTWSLLYFLNSASNLTNSLHEFTVPLQAFANQEIRIGFKATDGKVNNDEDYDLHLDDVAIEGLPPVDVGVTQIKSPNSNCGLSNTSSVVVSVRNFGSVTQTNFQILYRFNNGASVSQTFTGNLQPNQSTDFTFTTPAGIGAIGIYSFDAWTQATGDANIQNDSTRNKLVENSLAVNAFPYFEDFEDGKSGWNSGGNFSSWAFGGPNKSVINSPASGSNCWTTGGLNLGTYNSNEKSFVISPCFDFSSLNHPVVELKVWWHTEIGRDGAALQASVDGGVSWQNVGRFGDPNNWFNQQGVSAVGPEINPLEVWCGGVGTDVNGSGGWLVARNLLKTPVGNLAGYNRVKFRIMFGANSTVSGDGFAFDDIRIFEAPLRDMEMSAILSPTRDGCGFNSTVPVKIKIINKGREPLNNVVVNYRLNNQAVVTETIAASIDTSLAYEYTFNQTINLASPGTYSLSSWVFVPSDDISNNDSIKSYTLKVYNNAIDTVGFSSYNGTNLNFNHIGWREAKGNQPTGSVSNWTNCNLEQEASFGSRTARMTFNTTAVQKEWLISPPITCDSSTRLTFRHAATFFDKSIAASPSRLGGDDSLVVMASPDCGITWQRLYIFTKDSILKPTFRTVRIPLNSYNGQRIQIGFYATEGSNAIAGNRIDFHIDNILIVPSPAKDLAIVGLVHPESNCGLGAGESIKVRIFNNGSQPSGNYSVSYRLNSGFVNTQPVTDALASSQTTDIEFSTPANFSTLDNYYLKVWVSQSGDSVLVNDTLKVKLSRYGTPTPVFNFNGYGGSNLAAVYNSWTEGRGSNKPAGNQSNWTSHLMGSNTVAKIKLKKDTISEWLITYPIKLGGDPKLKFKAALRDSGNNNPSLFDDDRIFVMVTNDCGLTWSSIYTFADSTQPAISNLFQTYTINLTSFENQEVRIAFLAKDGAFAQYISEFFLDDIQIISAAQIADIGPTQLVSPGNNLIENQSYPLVVRLKNYGNQAISNVYVFALLGENNFSAFYPGPIGVGNSADVFLGDFLVQTSGPTSGIVYSYSMSDVVASNDTLQVFWDILTKSKGTQEQPRTLIFPNPAKDLLFIKGLDRERPSEKTYLKNVLGRDFEIIPQNLVNDVWVFDLKNLRPGLYFFQNNGHLFKIVKE